MKEELLEAKIEDLKNNKHEAPQTAGDKTLFQPLERILEVEETLYSRSSYWKDTWHRLISYNTTMGALAILGILFTCAILIPFFSSHSYSAIHLSETNQPPSLQFFFGTDELGRDMFNRIWWGARISLFIGISASLLDLVIGVLYGSISAYLGGKVDEILMRIADILHSIPHLLVALLLMVIMGPGLTSILVALTLTGWINMARIVRGQIIQLKQLDYIKAAQALGASRKRILFSHLIPNAIGPIIVTLTLTIPNAIFAEAFLSFLGLGVQAPIASWGTLARDGTAALFYYPMRLFFPASFISITMLCFNLLGDGLRDAFDPKVNR